MKPEHNQPRFEDAWKLKMKSIYKIPSITGQVGRVSDLELDIYLEKADGSEINKINDKRFLSLFGFDKLNNMNIVFNT